MKNLRGDIPRSIMVLIEETLFARGEITDRCFSQSIPNGSSSFEKVKRLDTGQYPNPSPGDRVTIHWDMGNYCLIDRGYVFTLPGYLDQDVWTSGIIHIPNPDGYEKCTIDEVEAEWHHIDRLLSNPKVTTLEFSR